MHPKQNNIGLGNGHRWRAIYSGMGTTQKGYIDLAYKRYKAAHSGHDKSIARFPLLAYLPAGHKVLKGPAL
jgi:hypothetical protein